MIKYIHTKLVNLNKYTIQNHPASKNFKSNLKLISNMREVVKKASHLQKKICMIIFL